MDADGFPDGVHERFSVWNFTHHTGDFHYKRILSGQLPLQQQVPQPVGDFLRHNEDAATFSGNGRITDFVKAFGDSAKRLTRQICVIHR